MELNPYLTFNGNCDAAFKYYEQHLGGKIVGRFTFGESPMANDVPKEHHDRIMHAALMLNGRLLMASDTLPSQPSESMQGFSLSINTNDLAEAEHVFHTLAEKGKVIMPLEQTFWALRFGMLVDQFGTPWMVNCDLPPQ